MNYPIYHFLLKKILEQIFNNQWLFLTKLHWEIDNTYIKVVDGKSYSGDIPNYDIVTTDISYCYENEYLNGSIKWDLKDLQNIRIVNLDNEIRNILYKFMQDLEKI